MTKYRSAGQCPLTEKITTVYLWFMALAFPLWCGTGGYQMISEAKALVFALSTGIFLAIMVLLPVELALIGDGTLKQTLKPVQRLSSVDWLLLAYLSWVMLSAAASPYEGAFTLLVDQREGALVLAGYLMLFRMTSVYGRLKPTYLLLLGGTVTVNLLLALPQYAGKNPLALFPAGMTYHDAFVRYSGQFLGTFGNVDMLSGFLCLAIPACWAGFVLKAGRRSWLLSAALFCGVLLLAMADVSSGWVGLAAALGLMWPLLLCRRERLPRGLQAFSLILLAAGCGKALTTSAQEGLMLQVSPVAAALLLVGAAMLLVGLRLPEGSSRDPKRVAAIGYGTLVILLVAAMILVYCVPFSGGTLGEVHLLLHGRADPSFGSSRLQIWQAAVQAIGERPLLGGGPGCFWECTQVVFTRDTADFGRIETVVESAHNDFLNIAVCSGIPALGLYLAALAALLIRWLRHLADVPLLLIPMAAAVGYLVQSFFTFSICSVTPLFWIFLGLGESLIREMEQGRSKK